jgi:hypothetical protein
MGLGGGIHADSFFKFPPQGSGRAHEAIALPCPFLRNVLEQYSKTELCGSLPKGEPVRE